MGAQHAQHMAPLGGGAPQTLQPMQPIQQQISIEQFMGQNPNTMPAEALPASIQQQPPMQAQHFPQQQAFGAQHTQHAQAAPQQHMQAQPQQYQTPQ
jgi:hypothetical protein